jgi:4-hydroxybutyryl-CoA dehydratase/vinylacetyl-CoA-Delta-isomerase
MPIPQVETVEERWARMPTIRSGADFEASLRGRETRLFLRGERLDEPADHPLLRGSINSLRATYELAEERPEFTAVSPYTGEKVNRFLHVTTSKEDLRAKHEMQRTLGQRTGTCFQRCVGLDAVSALHSVTFDIDEAHGTDYHARFTRFLTELQRRNLVLAGGMTDVKGDRSKRPHEQTDPDTFVHVTRRTDEGIFVRGAKAHMTGGWNSHWIVLMPTMALGPEDVDHAVVAALPVDAAGITYVYGRQTSDLRALDVDSIDQGNVVYGGQEVLVHFDEVFIPWEHVFLHGETEFARTLVQRFTRYHRSSYMCKTGLGDVLIGAAAEVVEMNGVPNASHIKDKLVEMVHLNETIWSSGVASAAEAETLPSGAVINDNMLTNVAKHNVTRFPYEIARLAQDLAGGIVATMPSEADLDSEEIGPLVDRMLRGRDDVPTEHRMRIMRLIENLTLGRNAVGYLTESMHGAGSPQAQRIEIGRAMDSEGKRALARRLAGIIEDAVTEP